MARVLSELFLSTGDTLYRRAAQELFESFATDFERDGFLLASIIDAAQFNARAVQVTIIGRRHDPSTRALWQLRSLDRHQRAGGGASGGAPGAWQDCPGRTTDGLRMPGVDLLAADHRLRPTGAVADSWRPLRLASDLRSPEAAKQVCRTMRKRIL
jgi:hypothetical protein